MIIQQFVRERAAWYADQMQYIGHLVTASGLQGMLIDGKVEGTTRRGPQRRTWAKDITDWAGVDYSKCIRLARDRRQWRLLIADLYERDGTR